MTYTVLSVAPNPRSYDANGPKLAYKVRFTEQAQDSDVEWSQKAETAPPTIGQQVDGTIDWNARFGPKFIREYQNKGGFGGSSSSTGGSTWKPRDPSETAAIQRQHCQKVAVQVAAAAGWFGNGFDPGDTAGQAKLGLVSRLATWFQRDIAKGVKVALEDAETKQSYGTVRDTQVSTGVSDVPSDAPVHPPVPKTEDIPW